MRRRTRPIRKPTTDSLPQRIRKGDLVLVPTGHGVAVWCKVQAESVRAGETNAVRVVDKDYFPDGFWCARSNVREVQRCESS